MSVRMVKCVKLGRELPGLARSPFPGTLGKRIFDNVSQEAWALWQQQQTLLINHHGLSMYDRRAQAFLMQQLEEFFFGQGPESIEGWEPEKP